MILKAEGDTVLVERIHEIKVGAIFIPDTAQKSERAIVISVGPDCPHNVKKGDVIRFQGQEGNRIEFAGKTYWSLRAKWVIAKEDAERYGEEAIRPLNENPVDPDNLGAIG